MAPAVAAEEQRDPILLSRIDESVKAGFAIKAVSCDVVAEGGGAAAVDDDAWRIMFGTFSVSGDRIYPRRPVLPTVDLLFGHVRRGLLLGNWNAMPVLHRLPIKR